MDPPQQRPGERSSRRGHEEAGGQSSEGADGDLGLPEARPQWGGKGGGGMGGGFLKADV